MSKRSSNQLNCFSPPVMLATLIIEITLAVYTVWRYKMNTLTRLVTAALVFLAAFQLSEYFVCTGYGLSAEHWSRAGFVAITVLPPLGLHILHELAGKPARKLVAASYASMAGFIGVFLSYQAAFIGHMCTGNYVIFQVGPTLGGAYYLYYFGWLLTAIILGLNWYKNLEATAKPSIARLESIKGLIFGYLVFMMPVAIANTVRPETRRGIPSIMCGFAVIFALILTMYVMPRMAELRDTGSDEKLPHKA